MVVYIMCSVKWKTKQICDFKFICGWPSEGIYKIPTADRNLQLGWVSLKISLYYLMYFGSYELFFTVHAQLQFKPNLNTVWCVSCGQFKSRPEGLINCVVLIMIQDIKIVLQIVELLIFWLFPHILFFCYRRINL